ncbi:hypothetical protein [Fluviispira vulneris]|uniref:hypothetical protein n=1 Tax=Fluviispira vulneris TaxID=2763012 RepID=UPI001646583F|nr:hypothetical protein [Fluviispira vulneris]
MSNNKSLYLKNQDANLQRELRMLKLPLTVKQLDPQFVETVASIIATFKDGDRLSESQKRGLAIMLIKAEKINDADFAEKQIAHIIDKTKKHYNKKRGNNKKLIHVPNFLIYHIKKRIGFWTIKLLIKCLKNPREAHPAFVAHACGALKAMGKEKAVAAFNESPEKLFKLIFEPEYYEQGYFHRSIFLKCQGKGHEQKRIIRERKAT